mgnify:FL=1
MEKIKLYQVDAFTNKLFGGNPAAVIILKSEIEDELMQKIALENNLSETAFVIKEENKFKIRWFTPLSEVDLCGHATLASAFVIFNFTEYDNNIIEFKSMKRGVLTVEKLDDFYFLNFPSDNPIEIDIPISMKNVFNYTPIKVLKGITDYMFVFDSEETIKDIKPNFELIKQSGVRGVIVTAKGNDKDFVSRFFAPFVGINEDPVTGSAHTMLIPYWSKELNKTKLSAIQLSKRMGNLECELLNERVKIGGNAVLFLIGEIEI